MGRREELQTRLYNELRKKLGPYAGKPLDKATREKMVASVKELFDSLQVVTTSDPRGGFLPMLTHVRVLRDVADDGSRVHAQVSIGQRTFMKAPAKVISFEAARRRIRECRKCRGGGEVWSGHQEESPELCEHCGGTGIEP